MRDLHRGEGDPARRRQPQGPRPVHRRGRRGPVRGRGLAVGRRREPHGAELRRAGRAAALSRSYGWERYLVKLAPARREAHDLPGRRLAPALLRSRAASRPRSQGGARGGRESFAARAVDARRSTIREVFDRANRCPMRSVSRSASRASVRRTTSSTAALEAARAGFTATRRTAGCASLRELLVAKLASVDGYQVGADQIVVTPGGMNALFSIYLALLAPGTRCYCLRRDSRTWTRW